MLTPDEGHTRTLLPLAIFARKLLYSYEVLYNTMLNFTKTLESKNGNSNTADVRLNGVPRHVANKPF